VKSLTIFEELDDKMIEILAPLFQAYSCPPGTVIFQQGDHAEFLYLVVDGKVDMSFKPYDGTPITVSHVGRGGLFGWSAVVGSDHYTSTAMALEDVEAYRIQGNELRKFCVENPEAGKDILERLADGVSSRWTNAHEQVKSILLQGIRDKSNLI
jgi:CRP-like cAMP-binding protein